MQRFQTKVASLQKRHENLLQDKPITEPSVEAFNVKSGDQGLHLQQHSIDTTSFILVTPYIRSIPIVRHHCIAPATHKCVRAQGTAEVTG
jgi:hypothetical protein